MSNGCDYQGCEFGANYLDSVCIDGYLWDADSGESGADGWVYDHGGEIPCPKCNHDCWLLDMGENVLDDGFQDGYEVKGVDTCPFPHTKAHYHKDGDGEVFRYCWLKGYWDGAAQKRADSALGGGTMKRKFDIYHKGFRYWATLCFKTQGGIQWHYWSSHNWPFYHGSYLQDTLEVGDAWSHFTGWLPFRLVEGRQK